MSSFPSSSLSQQTEAEATAQAYRDFMLGHTTNGIPSRHKGGTPNEIQHSKPSPSLVATSSRARKNFYSIIQAFQKCLHQWLQTDDQLLQVVHSIADLRARCWYTSRGLRKWDEIENEETKQGKIGNTIETRWKSFGYHDRHPTRWMLPRDNLDLALSDELIQHEKMIALLRRLLADLDQLQQMLSRRLDEVVTFYLEEQTLLDDNGSLQCAETVEECQQLFTATASELFRKQWLAQKVFNSTLDSLLCLDEANMTSANTTRPHASQTADDEQETPRGIAKTCANDWHRSCAQSRLKLFEKLLEKIVSTLDVTLSARK